MLDSRKSGLVVKEDVFKQNEKDYNHNPPPCLAKNGKSSAGHRRRSLFLPPFILDELQAFGQTLYREHSNKYNKLETRGLDRIKDKDLLRPYEDALIVAGQIPQVEEDLKIIKKYVDDLEGDWLEVVHSDNQRNTSGESTSKSKEARKIKNAKVARIAQALERTPAGIQILGYFHSVDAIKASYAYSLRPKFAYSVAMRQLCDIKAHSKGSTAFTTTFAETMSIAPAAAKVLAKSVDEMDY